MLSKVMKDFPSLPLKALAVISWNDLIIFFNVFYIILLTTSCKGLVI